MTNAGNLRFHFYEETITQNILLCLAEKSWAHLEILPYSRGDESETGADWLFCFRKGNDNISILAQAKRLYPDSVCYKNLGTGQQLTTLCEYANRICAIPLYIFFNGNFIDWDRKDYDRCDYCYKYVKGEGWGCSFATVDAVKRAVNKLKPDDIRMYPWHMLLNPTVLPSYNGDVSGLSLPELVRKCLMYIHDDNGLNKLYRVPEIKIELPSYINSLKRARESELNKKEAEESELDKWMKELSIGYIVDIVESEHYEEAISAKRTNPPKGE